MSQKSEIRKQMLAKRQRQSDREQKIKSETICHKIISGKIYQSSGVIYCYAPIQGEVDITPLIANALADDKIVALPKVEGEEIVFYQIRSMQDLEPGAFHVPEPKTGIYAPKADVIFVPGIAFTEDGSRMGYGGGFYDRYLSCHKIYSIGVAYDFQILKDIPTEHHDISLDEIISN